MLGWWPTYLTKMLGWWPTYLRTERHTLIFEAGDGVADGTGEQRLDVKVRVVLSKRVRHCNARFLLTY